MTKLNFLLIIYSILILGMQSFGGLDYYGTVFVDTEEDNDYFGIVFGYQSSSKFYTIMWKKVKQTYWDKEPFEAFGKTGLSIKVHGKAKVPHVASRAIRERPYWALREDS